MSDKNKTEQYVDAINSSILPHINYETLETSYSTDMTYAKGVLNQLHEAMVTAYGGEQLGEWDGDEGFVVIPGVVRSKESGKLCIALLDLDLSSAGEHWGTAFLCKHGVVPQTADAEELDGNTALQSKMREMNAAFVPYDYCYTAKIPCDIHVRQPSLPDELKAVLADFRNHRATLLHDEKPSVMDKLREGAAEPDLPTEPKEKPKKPGPEL